MTAQAILVVLLVFILAIVILCFISFKLAKIPTVAETLEKYERIIVPIVFIGIGLFILIEGGTIQHLIQLIG